MNRLELENMLDVSIQAYREHPEDELLRDNLNATQMLYHAEFDTWYRPLAEARINTKPLQKPSVWDLGVPLRDNRDSGYNHE